MTIRSVVRCLTFVLLLLSSPYTRCVWADPPAHTFETFTLGGQTFARGINASGVLAGYGVTPDDAVRAFVVRDSGFPELLGTLGGDDTQAFGINDAGVVVGVSTTSNGAQHAFVTQDATLLSLGTLGGTFSLGWAVNQHGAAAGQSSDEDGLSAAFRWQSDVPMHAVTGPGVQGVGYGINASGTVVGQARAPGATSARAFAAPAGGSSIDLGTLGGNASAAYAISDAGVVVGWAQTSAGFARAFKWTAGGGMVDLGTLGGNQSAANAIGPDGTIVGWAQDAQGLRRACLWTPDGQAVDLNSLVDPALGWLLTAAFGVNARGQVVGDARATVPGTPQRAFRLSPPAETVDATPPQITAASTTPTVLPWTGHALWPVLVSVTATDDSGAEPACAIDTVTSSEPDNGTGDGDTPGDVELTGALTVNLRGERAGGGPGRTYTIAVACSDEAGNTAATTLAVIVPRGGAANAPGLQATSAGKAPARSTARAGQ